MKREPNEVNATRLDMKLMARRKAQGMEQLAKTAVGRLEKNVKASMKKAGSGFLGSSKGK
jgi:hypothetical protein